MAKTAILVIDAKDPGNIRKEIIGFLAEKEIPVSKKELIKGGLTRPSIFLFLPSEKEIGSLDLGSLKKELAEKEFESTKFFGTSLSSV